MSGAGYNDPDKLAAARELAMSFGNSSQPRGGGGGGQRNGNNFGNRAPRERYNYSPPPPPHTVISNIPPPSRRNYTDTLVSGPVNRPPGQILGASSMDFLNRRDPTPQPTPANPTQAPPNQNTIAAIPSSMASNPVRNVAQKQNGTSVSGNENHTITPARANEGRIVDIKAESAKPLSTEGGQPNTNLPMSAAPAQAPARAPGSLQNNNIASTWAASYSDSSDEEEEEGEIIERPKAGPSTKEDAPNLPKADEVVDLIMESPDHKHNSLYRGGISAPPMVPTETTNGISVQKVRKNILLPVQENGRGPVQGSSAIGQASHEFATSRDQTRGENKPGEPNNTTILRPQAPGFVPGSRTVSLESPMSPSGFPPSAPTANPSAAKLDTEGREGAPSHQSHFQYLAVGNLDGSPSFAGHIITITPVRITTNGLIVPGPENSRAIMQPHLDTPQHHQTMPMQFPVMPITPGPTQPSQAGQNMTAAPVEKPKRKTQGLKSSMWAS
ncbi:hypothetical protein CDV31_006239 [Fusarium ambrosium]|uniref:Uncharacterized protein n=1 Tax=Fusarium ambrosium TaxID=131363 RepID=A0A428UES7_9HYPO|nr:hypothetical protein CDV31_006239 [Fusarium ambrosium]